MTQRRLWLSALVLAVLVQAGFVAAARASMEGCFFCAITTSASAPPEFVSWVVLVASAPLRQLLQGTGVETGTLFDGLLVPALIFAAVNAVFWTAGFFSLLNLVALAFRVRLERTSGTTRRFRLRSLAAVRPRSMAAVLLLLVAAGLAAGTLYRRWWLASAKDAVHFAVGSVRAGEPFRKSGRYDVSCYDCQPEHFAGTFAVRRHAGHPLDRFVPPTQVAGRLDFARGSRYAVNVYRNDGVWSVLLGPAD